MILQHLEITEAWVGYSGKVLVRDGDRTIQIVFGNDQVVSILNALRYELSEIVRVSPGYPETFMPEIVPAADPEVF